MTIDYDLDTAKLTKRLVAGQAKEFICTSCLLVHDRNELAAPDDERICRDCA